MYQFGLFVGKKGRESTLNWVGREVTKTWEELRGGKIFIKIYCILQVYVPQKGSETVYSLQIINFSHLNPSYICIHMWRSEVGTGCLPQPLSKLFSETGKSVVEVRVHLFCQSGWLERMVILLSLPARAGLMCITSRTQLSTLSVLMGLSPQAPTHTFSYTNIRANRFYTQLLLTKIYMAAHGSQFLQL